MSGKWESLGAAVYYTLGISYYIYEWLIGIGVGGGLISFIFRHKIPSHPVLILASTVMFSAGLVVVGITSWLVATKKRLHFQNPDLAVTKMVDTYEAQSPNHYTFEKTIAVQALRTGVNSYSTRLRWSGRGLIEPSINPESGCTINLAKTADDFDTFRVQFPRPLVKKEPKIFTLRFDMVDEEGHARPFLQKYIDDYYPGGLTLRVVLPSSPRKILKEIFLSPRVELPLWASERNPKDESREFSWRIRKPALGRRYRLSWEP
jgi:hypothetical protein